MFRYDYRWRITEETSQFCWNRDTWKNIINSKVKYFFVCMCVCERVCVHYAGSCCGITLVCRNSETTGATTSGLFRWTWWSPGTLTTVCWGRERSDGEHLIFLFYITLCGSASQYFFKRKIFSLMWSDISVTVFIVVYHRDTALVHRIFVLLLSFYICPYCVTHFNICTQVCL